MNDKVFLVMYESDFGDGLHTSVSSAHRDFAKAEAECVCMMNNRQEWEYYYVDAFVLEE